MEHGLPPQKLGRRQGSVQKSESAVSGFAVLQWGGRRSQAGLPVVPVNPELLDLGQSIPAAHHRCEPAVMCRALARTQTSAPGPVTIPDSHLQAKKWISEPSALPPVLRNPGDSERGTPRGTAGTALRVTSPTPSCALLISALGLSRTLHT